MAQIKNTNAIYDYILIYKFHKNRVQCPSLCTNSARRPYDLESIIWALVKWSQLTAGLTSTIKCGRVGIIKGNQWDILRCRRSILYYVPHTIYTPSAAAYQGRLLTTSTQFYFLASLNICVQNGFPLFPLHEPTEECSGLRYQKMKGNAEWNWEQTTRRDTPIRE